MAMVSGVLMIGAVAFLTLLLLDTLMPRALAWLAPFLPNDVCGPGGWLSDTKDRTGVFDRPARR